MGRSKEVLCLSSSFYFYDHQAHNLLMLHDIKAFVQVSDLSMLLRNIVADMKMMGFSILDGNLK